MKLLSMAARILAITLIGVMASGVTSADADATKTKTLITGQGVIGAHDGANHFTTDGGATWAPAFNIEKHPAWANPLPGTNWIGIDDAGAPVDATYRTHFSLPATFADPSLSITIAVDDCVTVYLNGVSIGSRCGFTTHGVIATANPALFKKGQNELTFVVDDTGFVIAGLNYEATLTYTAGGKGN